MTSAPPARLTAAVLLACAPLAAAGCGGSSKPLGDAGAPIQRGRDVRPLPVAGGAPAEARGALGGSARTDGAIRPTGPQRARNPHGLIDDEVASSAAKPPDPCALVSRTEAQQILSADVQRPVLAPQGPTCIYKVKGSQREVTLAVLLARPTGASGASSSTGASLQGRLQHRMRVKVGGRHAFCGVAGSPTLVMALPGGRVLSVVAPCPIAAAFAARALGHLGSAR